jgi:hypothetical protein
MGWLLFLAALGAAWLLYMRWSRRNAERQRAAEERAAALMAEAMAAAKRDKKSSVKD